MDAIAQRAKLRAEAVAAKKPHIIPANVNEIKTKVESYRAQDSAELCPGIPDKKITKENVHLLFGANDPLTFAGCIYKNADIAVFKKCVGQGISNAAKKRFKQEYGRLPRDNEEAGEFEDSCVGDEEEVKPRGEVALRELLEHMKDKAEQCNRIIGKFVTGSPCYICGFPIKSDQEPQCDHILPLATGLLLFEIYYHTGENKPNPERDAKRKLEYAWSHGKCNGSKSNNTFLIQKLVGPNDIVYSVDTKSISDFLRQLFIGSKKTKEQLLYPEYKSQIGTNSSQWVATQTESMMRRYQSIVDLFPAKENVRDFMMKRIEALRKNIVKNPNTEWKRNLGIEDLESNELDEKTKEPKIKESETHVDSNDRVTGWDLFGQKNPPGVLFTSKVPNRTVAEDNPVKPPYATNKVLFTVPVRTKTGSSRQRTRRNRRGGRKSRTTKFR